MDFLLTCDDEDEVASTTDGRKDSEFTQYISLPTPSHNSNPIHWWRQYVSNFLILSSLAKRYLGPPSTSAPSERISSAARNIVNSRRSCLLPSNVNILVLFNKNLKTFSIYVLELLDSWHFSYCMVEITSIFRLSYLYIHAWVQYYEITA